MSEETIQLDIDPDLVKQAEELFNLLGLDLQTACSIFFHQVVLRGGMPFEYEPDKQND